MDELHALIERSLEFRYESGAVTVMTQPHSTGWRVLPTLTTAQVHDGWNTVAVDGGRPLRVGDGDAFCVVAGVRHISTLRTATAVSRWSHVYFRVFGAIDALTLIEPPLLLTGAAGRRLGDINAALAALPAGEHALGVVARRKSLGFELLALIAEGARPAPGALDRARAIQRLAPALAVVERDLGSGVVAIPLLARAAGVSPSRLHALFHAALGCAPLHYVQAQRLRRAQQLLMGTDLPVQVVATRSGFGDPFHFSRSFRKAIGQSPREYREHGKNTGL